MGPSKNIRIKVCCISSKEEAKLAIQYGASALGLVGKMPSGPGVISDREIAQIARFIPPPLATFLLTSETSARSIVNHHHKVHTSTIQIVDALKDGSYQELRQDLPGIKLVQVIHVVDEGSIKEAFEAAQWADALLLDSGNPRAKVRELGGTGRVHNWDFSREIRERINIPLFLAGGLNAENVQEAIEIVKPFGVDVCSGVRSNGFLDENKLKKFVENVQKVQ